MKTKQILVKNKDLNTKPLADLGTGQPQLGFLFGSKESFANREFLGRLKAATPGTTWIGCSTGGEISMSGVTDLTVVLTTVLFENPKSEFKIVHGPIRSGEESYAAGKELAEKLKGPGLNSVLVLAPGSKLNGSNLVRGIADVLGRQVPVTGGLAGDGDRFGQTYTLTPDGLTENDVVALGFYGETLQFQHGCMGGWDSFGKVRKVTKAQANVLYELDGRPALDIYKEYLGPHSKDLPASGLMFPFAMLRDDKGSTGLIRTILAIDEEKASLTMAGNIVEGSMVRLMHANTEGLVAGAKLAAESAVKGGLGSNGLAIVISCVGRKIMMGTNVDDEIDKISEIFGPNTVVAGFYSYGEISPYLDTVGCELHNQTMTLSYFYEKE